MAGEDTCLLAHKRYTPISAALLLLLGVAAAAAAWGGGAEPAPPAPRAPFVVPFGAGEPGALPLRPGGQVVVAIGTARVPVHADYEFAG
jgi:hypothetical protein